MSILRVLMSSGYAMAAAVAIPGAAVAAQERQAYDISALPMPDALRRFAVQSNVELIFDQQLVSRRTSRAVRGNLTFDQALGVLLQGSGLQASRTGAGTLVITQREEAPRAPSGISPAAPEHHAAPASGAQTTAPAAQVAEDNTLGDIVVTARRSNENLQRVPVAVTVLSGEALEKRRITSARDLQYTAPSLVVASDPLGGTTAPVLQLRGQAPPLGTDDTVVAYLRDVPVNSRAFAGGLFDLQSVQVLRGPQGTLFGKNSTGGAVIFTPRMADSKAVSGFLDGTVGNYSLFQLGGGVNVPLIADKLGVRFSGQITRQKGFVRNLSGPDGADKHYEVARVSLVATPTDELRNETFFNYFHGRQHQNPLIARVYNRPLVQFLENIGAAAPGTAAAFQAEFDRQQQLGARTIDYSFGRNNDNNDVYIITNTTSYDFGGTTLKNIIGYYDQKPRVRLSQTSTNTPLVDVIQNKDQTSLSEELQLSGDTGSLKWIVGGFFSREKTRTFQNSWLSGALANRGVSHDRYISKALFAQGTYSLTNGLKFTAGLRHSWDKRAGVLDVGTFPGGVFTPSPQIANTRRDRKYSWTVGVDYQASRDLLFYVTSRRSYKAGGLNLVSSVIPAALQQYEPEQLTDVEIGAKSTIRFGDSTIRANIAAYRGWYKNIHTTELANCGTVASYTVNAAKGSPKGLEFEFDAAVTRRLRVGGFYNRTLGKFDKFQLVTPPGCSVIGAGVDLNGTDFPNINKNSAGLNGSYTVPLGGVGDELELSGNWYYRSHRLGNATGGFNAAYPGYSLFNARLDYNNIGGTNFGAGVWVRNITDKLYVAHRNNVLTLAGYDVYAYGEPRTYGIDLKYRF